MWIHCTNPATRRLYNADLMEEPVEFTANGYAQVSRAVGETLIEQYDQIVNHESDEGDTE